MLGVNLGRFRRVVHGVVMMAIGSVGMMSGEMMIAGVVMARGFAMMPCRVLVVLRCFAMMLGCLLRHGFLLQKCQVGGELRLNRIGYEKMNVSLQLAVKARFWPLGCAEGDCLRT
jgi:hypothetical protein